MKLKIKKYLNLFESNLIIFFNLGNMVFTRFKYYPSGEIEELDVKVIDVGIGLERIPWLINGASTSYEEVFGNSYKWL